MTRSHHLRRARAALAAAVAPALIAFGCGSSTGSSTGAVKQDPEHSKRTRQMEDFMKGEGKEAPSAK